MSIIDENTSLALLFSHRFEMPLLLKVYLKNEKKKNLSEKHLNNEKK
jgi:hypothetical protein